MSTDALSARAEEEVLDLSLLPDDFIEVDRGMPLRDPGCSLEDLFDTPLSQERVAARLREAQSLKAGLSSNPFSAARAAREGDGNWLRGTDSYLGD